MRAVAAALAALLLANGAALADDFHAIDVRVTPITHFARGDDTQTRFGALTFLGGFVLSSLDPGFGGWSGLDFATDGSLIAEADTGFWLRGRLTETNGAPTGLANPEIGVMLGENGQPAPNKIATDAEGLRITTIGGVETALVSFEQTPMIRAFSGPDFAAAVPKRIALPKFVNHLPRNLGLESIAVAPADGPLAGAIVTIAEHALDASGNHRGFVLSGPATGTFMIKRRDDFDISDADFLPDGDLLLLERKFSLMGGFGMRLRLIHAA
ncbi:MAG TPA: esterase-like activity of phytase family protein, partial [Bauldia sp.]|nr:esterase-like activity of phytase family protein [Bauldia sp.]